MPVSRHNDEHSFIEAPAVSAGQATPTTQGISAPVRGDTTAGALVKLRRPPWARALLGTVWLIVFLPLSLFGPLLAMGLNFVRPLPSPWAAISSVLAYAWFFGCVSVGGYLAKREWSSGRPAKQRLRGFWATPLLAWNPAMLDDLAGTEADRFALLQGARLEWHRFTQSRAWVGLVAYVEGKPVAQLEADFTLYLDLAAEMNDVRIRLATEEERALLPQVPGPTRLHQARHTHLVIEAREGTFHLWGLWEVHDYDPSSPVPHAVSPGPAKEVTSEVAAALRWVNTASAERWHLESFSHEDRTLVLTSDVRDPRQRIQCTGVTRARLTTGAWPSGARFALQPGGADPNPGEVPLIVSITLPSGEEHQVGCLTIEFETT